MVGQGDEPLPTSRLKELTPRTAPWWCRYTSPRRTVESGPPTPSDVLQQMYQLGLEYKKAAVMLSKLQPEGQRQSSLWKDEAEELDRERTRRLMGVLDKVNPRFGRGAVHLGALGTKPA